MKIWQLDSIFNGFETLGLLDFDRDYKIDDKLIKVTPLVNNWKEVEICTIDEGENSDCPHFWDWAIPVFSEKALHITQYFLQDKAEALPIIHPKKKFFAIHVINAIDAIDYNRAVIKELSTGLRLNFEKYAFIKEQVEGEHIFRIYLDESLMWMVFVSDEFKKTVESNGLVGFQFIEVWDSKN